MTDSLERIGEISRDGMFIYHLGKNQFTYINKPFAAICHTSVETLKNNPSSLTALIRTEDVDYLKSVHKTLLLEKTIRSAEFRMHNKQEGICQLSADAYLLDDDTVVVFCKRYL